MRPVSFEGVNSVLISPDKWDVEKRGKCKDLPVMRRDGICISKWAMDWKERVRILFGGSVYIHIASGATQPPISLTVDK